MKRILLRKRAFPDNRSRNHPIEAYSVSLFPVINMKRREDSIRQSFLAFLKILAPVTKALYNKNINMR
ncbi:hypothetical protein AA984_23550 [Brevibacillus formosus]|uniref:Uncharacterized protein n=1 Tax=Brevibacillus formosus TaxID=54913 RepID=A0A837KIH2_9BACL|nr:hypothetical protein AA984_23550 [Brevibacillus formosus]PSJ90302.1 hypothetical protein C7R91_26225 [Brevibacillus formosus]